MRLSDKNVEQSKSIEPPKITSPTPPERFVSVAFKEGQTKLYDYFIGGNYNLQVGDLVEVTVNSPYSGRELKIATVKYVSRLGEYSEHARATVIRKIQQPLPPPEIRTVVVEKSVYVSQPIIHEVKQSYCANVQPSSQSTVPASQPMGTTYQPTPLPTTNRSFESEKIFVQVIFKKNGKKRFDYLLGDNHNVHVGDFVVVRVNNKGKTTWKIAKVLYVSQLGEVSPYAKSPIIKKADYPKW